MPGSLEKRDECYNYQQFIPWDEAMAANYYDRGSSEEWRKLTKERRREAGLRALANCRILLAETKEEEPIVPRETPCEHDYQPSTLHLEADECTKCHAVIAADLDRREWFDEVNK